MCFLLLTTPIQIPPKLKSNKSIIGFSKSFIVSIVLVYCSTEVSEQDYRTEKGKLILQKKSLEEEISTFSHKQNDWLAPFQNWLKDAQSLDKIASGNNLFSKKVVAREIFGSHLLLGEKTLQAAEGGAPNSFGKSGKTAWAALCAAHSAVPSKPLSSILVPFV